MAITVLFASMSTLSDFGVRSCLPRYWLIFLSCLSIDNAFFDLYSALHAEKRHGETKEVLRRDRQYTYEVPPSFKPFSAAESVLAPDPPGSLGSLGFLVCRLLDNSNGSPDPITYNDGIRVTMDRLGILPSGWNGWNQTKSTRKIYRKPCRKRKEEYGLKSTHPPLHAPLLPPLPPLPHIPNTTANAVG